MMRKLTTAFAVAGLLLLNLASHCLGEQKVALLVGVNEYDKPGFDKLRHAERDVTETAKELRKLGFRTVVLTGSQQKSGRATRANIEAELAKLVAPLGKKDVMLVMFTGHGHQPTGDEAYFCPADAVFNRVETMVSLSKVLDDVLAPNVGRKLLLVDACRNDPDPSRGRGIQGKVIALPEDTAVYFSCRAYGRSFESDQLQHGVFTYCVLEGLRGAAVDEGTITWASLVAYVDKRMSQEAILKYLPQGRRQTPITAGGVPYTVLGKQAEREMTSPKIPSPSPPRLGELLTNSAGMKLKRVRGGTFMMGSAEGERDRSGDEGPVHEVRISKDFYLGLTEVTQGQWEAVMGTRPWLDEAGRPRSYVKVGENYPAVYVSWNDAVAFCQRLSTKEGVNYRLPTEAEWEYACRAGTRTAYSFGDAPSELGRYMWYDGNAYDVGEKYAHAVGQKLPNPWGFYDMHGNVWEWCSDWYASEYYGNSPAADPQGPAEAQSSRVYRGGSWYSDPQYCRSANRDGLSPTNRFNDLGFRVLRSSVQ